MGKFVRGTFTVLGIIEFLAFIRIYIEEVNVPFSSKMTILVAAIIFTFLGYIPEKIYKNYIKKCINKYYEEQFLKEEEQFLKNKEHFSKEEEQFLKESSSQNQNHNNIRNSSYINESNVNNNFSSNRARQVEYTVPQVNSNIDDTHGNKLEGREEIIRGVILFILMYAGAGTFGYFFTEAGGIKGAIIGMVLFTVMIFVPILDFILAAIIGYALGGFLGLIVGCIVWFIIRAILGFGLNE